MKIGYFLNFYPTEARLVAEEEMLEMLELGHEIYVFPLLGRLAPVEAIPAVLRERVYYLSNKTVWKPFNLFLKYFLTFKWKLFRYIIKNRQYVGVTQSLLLLEVVGQIKKLNVERLHVHFASNAAIKAIVVSDLTGIPFSCTGHGSEILLYPDKLLPEIIKRANPFITISNYNKKVLIEKYNLPEETIKVLYCGVDLKRFQPTTKTAFHTLPHILSVTWMRPEKGIKYLVEACCIFGEKGLAFRCTIVGGGKDFEDIKKLVTCLGMEGIINLPGALSHKEIIELYKTADIFVLPSLSEGIPIVIMEAMAMELPVVSTRIAGIPEIVDDRVNGFLVNPKDPEALAKKIEYLIHHPYLREDMGKKGRKIIEEKFDLDKNIRILEGWFKGQIFSPEAGVKNL